MAERTLEEGKRPTPGEFYRRACCRLGELEGTSVVVEKTPHHVHWVDRVGDALPRARFLACIRDPYDFPLSYKHQGDRKPESVRCTFEAMYHSIVTLLEVIREAQEFLDVPVEDGLDVGHENTSFPASERPGLESAEIFWMNRVAGPAVEEPGLASLRVPSSVADPACPAIRMLRTVTGATEGSLWRYLWVWIRSSS